MGKRGPAPTPTKLKLLKGNPGKRAVNAQEPVATKVTHDLPAPKDLPAVARDLWVELMPQLRAMRVLTQADVIALRVLCEVYAEYRAARTVVERDGMTHVSIAESGFEMIMKRPEVGIAADAQRRLLRLMQEFGLTPSARSAIKVPEAPPADPLSDFLRGGRASGG